MAQKNRKAKTTEQDRYWVLEWDLLDAINEPNKPREQQMHGNAKRLWTGQPVPRLWSVQMTVVGSVVDDPERTQARRTYTFSPDQRVCLRELMLMIREQVDQYLFDECQDIAASSIKIRARSPK